MHAERITVEGSSRKFIDLKLQRSGSARTDNNLASRYVITCRSKRGVRCITRGLEGGGWRSMRSHGLYACMHARFCLKQWTLVEKNKKGLLLTGRILHLEKTKAFKKRKGCSRVRRCIVLVWVISTGLQDIDRSIMWSLTIFGRFFLSNDARWITQMSLRIRLVVREWMRDRVSRANKSTMHGA